MTDDKRKEAERAQDTKTADKAEKNKPGIEFHNENLAIRSLEMKTKQARLKKIE